MSSSNAGIKSGSQVTAQSLEISASREAKIGQNTEVNILSGELLVTSTGSTTGSHAIVKSGAHVNVAGDMHLVSGNKATIRVPRRFDRSYTLRNVTYWN